MTKDKAIAALPPERLGELLDIYAKEIFAVDGVWFQAIEDEEGMDKAMFYDVEAWKRFAPVEGRKMKKFLRLPEHPGLEGLEQALHLRFAAAINATETSFDDDGDLICRVMECRVFDARRRKGMDPHPCRLASYHEFADFASTIDDRIVCTCVSCPPDVTDDTCCCMWRFSLRED